MMTERSSISEQQQLSADQWIWLSFRGILAIIFAIAAISSPIATAWVLALFWGAFAFLEGASAIAAAWRLHKQRAAWWPCLLFGIIGILAGALAVVWPGLTMLVLVYMIGIWAIVGGISEIFMSVSLRKSLDYWWWMLLAGICGVLFGMLILYAPIEGILMMIWCLAGFTLFSGILSLLLAFQLKRGKAVVSLSANKDAAQTRAETQGHGADPA